MDDFSIFSDSFDLCLLNLEKVLKHCEEINLMLNWGEVPFYGTRSHSIRPQNIM